MVMGTLTEETEVAVIGGGPGGYVAAIRAADLGREVTLIDEREQLGGVCLLEGCIPSKALINAVELAQSARAAGRLGLRFTDLTVDVEKLRGFTSEVVSGLTRGVHGLLSRRGINVLQGRARFKDERTVALEGGPDITFGHAIIATGSRPRPLPMDRAGLDLWYSREALALPRIPASLLVVGGGYIGLELGLVYAGLGSRITIVEGGSKLMAAADEDLVEPVRRSCEERFHAIRTGTRVESVERTATGYAVTVDQGGQRETITADQVLVSIGRLPNTDDLGLETAGITTDGRGLIPIDDQCRTEQRHIFAIGDVTPGPMLAHKASREAKVAAEVIAGHAAAFDNRAIPAVVFTDPEIAWTGLTEKEASDQGRAVTVGRFPLRALGRARTLGRTDGLVKVISDPRGGLVLGVGMVGPSASDLIAEAVLAIEMGATLEDLMVTIHPHPTLSEAILEAAEQAAGQPVHLPPRSR